MPKGVGVRFPLSRLMATKLAPKKMRQKWSYNKRPLVLLKVPKKHRSDGWNQGNFYFSVWDKDGGIHQYVGCDGVYLPTLSYSAEALKEMDKYVREHAQSTERYKKLMKEFRSKKRSPKVERT